MLPSSCYEVSLTLILEANLTYEHWYKIFTQNISKSDSQVHGKLINHDHGGFTPGTQSQINIR